MRLAPQLPTGFGDDVHKTRYLGRAVLGQPFAQQPISQITSSRYSFTQFTTAMKENLQLREELSRATAPELNYGQYVSDPRDVRPSNFRWLRESRRSDKEITAIHRGRPLVAINVTVPEALASPRTRQPLQRSQ